MNRQNYLNIKKSFAKFVNEKSNRPKKDPHYGNKIEGNIKFIHFIIYAIICRKDPVKTTHDEYSENYIYNMELIKKLIDGKLSIHCKNEFLAPFLSETSNPEEIIEEIKKNMQR